MKYLPDQRSDGCNSMLQTPDSGLRLIAVPGCPGWSVGAGAGRQVTCSCLDNIESEIIETQ